MLELKLIKDYKSSPVPKTKPGLPVWDLWPRELLIITRWVNFDFFLNLRFEILQMEKRFENW